eukprot:TRINITY_DN23131_c0_g1_i3.p1 TRINITY_DN23131_c0_g1~~TRINITY_DN23131_c0_g1_i3.p1  ORF type:complete len:248 (+),score=32.32 TRINITY_DN23131_c0_g1_i3:299-1042(+)
MECSGGAGGSTGSADSSPSNVPPTTLSWSPGAAQASSSILITAQKGDQRQGQRRVAFVDPMAARTGAASDALKSSMRQLGLEVSYVFRSAELFKRWALKRPCRHNEMPHCVVVCHWPEAKPIAQLLRLMAAQLADEAGSGVRGSGRSAAAACSQVDSRAKHVCVSDVVVFTNQTKRLTEMTQALRGSLRAICDIHIAYSESHVATIVKGLLARPLLQRRAADSPSTAALIPTPASQPTSLNAEVVTL